MKIIECEQYSDVWYNARCGKPSASQAHRIITPAKWLPSESSGEYAAELLSEWYCGHPFDTIRTAPMERGSELEEEAVAAFEFQTGIKTKPVGFMLTDDEQYGASPDRICEDGSLLEIKCLLPHNHMSILLSKQPEQKRMPQLMMQMLVSGARLNRLFFYNEEMPYVQIDVPWDETKGTKLKETLDSFCADLAAKKLRLEQEYKNAQ